MANNREPAYVGVSGFNNGGSTSFGTQISVEGSAADSGLLEYRVLLEGVKATHKTQMLDEPNRYGPRWYPVGADLRYALRGPGESEAAQAWDQHMVRVAQVYLDNAHVGSPEYRQAFIDRIFERAASWGIQGIQFDQLPADLDPALVDEFAKIVEERQAIVIIQCHAEALQALDPKTLIQRLGVFARAGAVQHILLDASGGKGRALDVEMLRPYLVEAFGSAALARVGIGVAGGLDGPTVRRLLPELLAEFRDLSWDAEAKLRHATPDMSSEAAANLQLAAPGDGSYLNRKLVQRYLEASAEILAKR